MPRPSTKHSQPPAAPAMQGSPWPWQHAGEVHGEKGGAKVPKRKDTAAPAAGLPGLAGPSKMPKMTLAEDECNNLLDGLFGEGCDEEAATPGGAAAGGGEQCQPQPRRAYGPYKSTVTAKRCKLCLGSSTDDDPVAQARGEVGEQTLRWDRKQTKVCYYCARVHERKYRQLTRQELVHQVRSQPDADEAQAELDKFLAFRTLAINLLAARGQGGRMSKGFVDMDIAQWP